jgi:hypothetical protein
MTTSHRGLIAQLVYGEKHHLDFARIVGDLHSLLVRCPRPQLIFEWEGNDIALFDLFPTRIALGWNASPGKGYAACLTVSVGSVTERPLQPFSNGHQDMCSRLVERLHKDFPALAIFWHETEEHVSADLIDRLVEDLPPVMQLFPFEQPKGVRDTMTRQSPRGAAAMRPKDTATEHLISRKTGHGLGSDPRKNARQAVSNLKAIRATVAGSREN